MLRPRAPVPTPKPIRPPEIVVQVDTSGWDSKIRTAINNRNQLKIVLRGQKVAAVKGAFPDICKTPAPPASSVPIPYPSVESALRAANLLPLALLIASAAPAGYRPPGMNYNPRGAGSQDDELVIYLQ